jgi:protease I
MANDVSGRRVAVLISNGFEQSELVEPMRALTAAGAKVDIVSPKKDRVRGWQHTDWGDEFDVDVHIDDARVGSYDALVLPGGLMNPDFLRMDQRAVDLAAAFMASGKPVAAICHGPWLLVETGALRGRRLTSYLSLRTDIVNAGGEWEDADVVVDGALVTSRRPDDLPAFCRELLRVLAERQSQVSAAE